ncbi:armadillo-type protein [Vararia minispora EC-137]|uniref:Armadillo-type protein n=1 Tax=Vararia minispora EC-137 TaxID=1314806 RepID=A0ACB8QU08_9AGAM|nr:armadillo-type protein [Vararia minispora EC-137]
MSTATATAPARSRAGFNLFSQDPPPPSRSLAASIWAPQPQASRVEPSWPQNSQTLASTDDQRTRQVTARVPDIQRVPSLLQQQQQPPTTTRNDDFFGPQGMLPMQLQKRDIGAIGDGRRRSGPDDDAMHIAQLLRALDLNSPAPAPGPLPPLQTQTSFSLNLNASPDLSPCSAASSLLTPSDSPARGPDFPLKPAFDFNPPALMPTPSSLMLDSGGAPFRTPDLFSAHAGASPQLPPSLFRTEATPCSLYDSMGDIRSSSSSAFGSTTSLHHMSDRVDPRLQAEHMRHAERFHTSTEWLSQDDALRSARLSNLLSDEANMRPPLPPPINFLSLLHPSSSPPYALFVSRIIKSSDQQASIFLQQKLKVADAEERGKIIDAICARGFEMMAHRFGNWAVQRCIEAASTAEERRKIVYCMRGRVVELAMNCYGCHVLQKALDCEEEVRLQIVSELLLGDPAQTLVNKHASHVWSKIMELTWTPPAPPIFAYVNSSLKGKWASLACHETGSLVVQHAFENLEESAKDGIVDELLNQGPAVFTEVAKNQWGSYCIQHILEHGSLKHRQLALEHIVSGLLDFATNEQGSKSVTKALKEGGKDTLDRIVKRMAESAKGGRRAIIVDLALSVTGSQLIAAVLPNIDKDQRTILYDAIRGHIVTLRGCKTGSKVIWLL